MFVVVARTREQIEPRGHNAAVDRNWFKELIAIFALVKAFATEQRLDLLICGPVQPHRKVHVYTAGMRRQSSREQHVRHPPPTSTASSL